MEKKKKGQRSSVYTVIFALIIMICIAIAMTISQKASKTKSAVPTTVLTSGMSTDSIDGVSSSNHNNLSLSASGSSSAASNGRALTVQGSREIKRTASIKIVSKDIAKDVDSLASLCKKNDGYVASSYIEEHSGTITIFVPQKKTDEVIKKIRDTYGIDTVKEDREDLTDSYVDNESRLGSKKAALKRYQELLEKAQTVEEIMSVQTKVDEIQEDIDAYERTKKSYDMQTDYTEISVTLSDDKIIEAEDTGNEVTETLKSGAENFILFLINLIFLIPAFFIILLVITVFYKFFGSITFFKNKETERL